MTYHAIVECLENRRDQCLYPTPLYSDHVSESAANVGLSMSVYWPLVLFGILF